MNKRTIALFLFIASVLFLFGCEFFDDRTKAISVSTVALDGEVRGLGVEVSFDEKQLRLSEDDIVEVGVVAVKGKLKNPAPSQRRMRIISFPFSNLRIRLNLLSPN